MVVVPVVPPIIVPPRIMPKRVAARPATVETSAMSERCCTGQVRLKSEPRVIGRPPICQVALDDFFTTRRLLCVFTPIESTHVANEVEFFA